MAGHTQRPSCPMTTVTVRRQRLLLLLVTPTMMKSHRLGLLSLGAHTPRFLLALLHFFSSMTAMAMTMTYIPLSGFSFVGCLI